MKKGGKRHKLPVTRMPTLRVGDLELRGLESCYTHDLVYYSERIQIGIFKEKKHMR